MELRRNKTVWAAKSNSRIPRYLTKNKQGKFEWFRSFCLNSSLLGLRYIVERKSWIEKCVWLLGLALGIGSCGMLVMQTWSRWRSSTVIKQRSISDIPFPAVTVCPGLSVDLDRLRYDEYIERKMRNNTSEEEMEIFRDLILVCPEMDISLCSGMLNNTRSNKAIETIERHALTIGHYVDSVGGYMREEKPWDFFRPIITEIGLCYSSNAFPGDLLFETNTFHSRRRYLNMHLFDSRNTRKLVQWSPGYGYLEESGANAYPIRVLGVGKSAGVYFRFNPKPQRTDMCSQGDGIVFTVHNPADIAHPLIRGFKVPRDALVDVSVTPEVVWTDNNVRHSYAPSERQCFYPDERRLRFFKQYTQANCELECLANFTLRLCGCVGFYMPRDLHTAICTPMEGNYCIKFASWRMQRLQANIDSGPEDEYSYAFNPMTQKEEKEMYCRCLQTCNSLDYKIRVTFTYKKNHTFLQLSQGAQFFFESSHYTPINRIEIFGMIDFVAGCGGILGLCLGFSFLTVVEFFYWLIVRPLVEKCLLKNRVNSSRKNQNIVGRNPYKNTYTISEFI